MLHLSGVKGATKTHRQDLSHTQHQEARVEEASTHPISILALPVFKLYSLDPQQMQPSRNHRFFQKT